MRRLLLLLNAQRPLTAVLSVAVSALSFLLLVPKTDTTRTRAYARDTDGFNLLTDLIQEWIGAPRGSPPAGAARGTRGEDRGARAPRRHSQPLHGGSYLVGCLWHQHRVRGDGWTGL